MSQVEVAAVYRGMLKRDPDNQAVIDHLVSLGVDLERLVSLVTQLPEYQGTIAGRPVAFDPPPITKLVPPWQEPEADRRRVAVLVRSHVLDEKFDHLWQTLNGQDRRFDVFPLLDQAALGTSADWSTSKYPGTIWNHPNQLPALGFTQKSSKYNIFWLAGDLSMGIALTQEPLYEYYIMIDYDVHFTKSATAYLNGLCERLMSQTSEVVDAVGLEFKSRLVSEGATPEWPNFMDWEFYAAAAEVFPQVYHFYFPFVVLSRRAVMQVFTQRQLEAARRTPGDKIVNCEAFVPSSLMAAGLKCVDLNTFMPGSYELDSMGLQHLRSDRLSGQPLSFAIRHPQADVEMIHAVYSQEGFLERNFYQRRGSQAELEWFSAELTAKFASSLDKERVEAYLMRVRAEIAAL